MICPNHTTPIKIKKIGNLNNKSELLTRPRGRVTIKKKQWALAMK